jgi:hypothetical protein
MQMRRRVLTLLGLVTLCTVAIAQTLPDAQAKHVLQQAHEKHYSLQTAGLTGFTGELHPAWEPFFQQLKVDLKDPLPPLIKQVHFYATFTSDGEAKITHSALPAADEALTARMTKSVGGFEQMVGGFYQTWSFFGYASPLPDTDSTYQVESVKGKYLLTYHEDKALIRTTITPEFAVEEMNYAGPTLSVDMHATWMQTAKGFLLSGYDGLTEIQPQGKVHIEIKINYETVDGFALPSKVEMVTPTPNGTLDVTFTFTDYKVTKR